MKRDRINPNEKLWYVWERTDRRANTSVKRLYVRIHKRYKIQI